MLEINNYNSTILKDINFYLKENENLIILGQNGAGKSTLAKVLSNLIENSSVVIKNENIKKLDDKKRAQLINYIPPKFEIFDEYLTLCEFLELSFIKEIDYKKIDEVISLLKLEKLKDRACIDFSSGEKQLLLLASSILHDAEITIFDELTANLDLNRVKDVFDILNSSLLSQKIVITHNLDFAYALKDFKVLFLQKGSLKFFGSHSEFFIQENLNRFYGENLKLLDSHLVLDL